MNTLRITIPKLCNAEVKYVMHCVFDSFLGLDYTIDISSSTEKYIIQSGDQKIFIDNHFFKTDDLSKLYSESSLPVSASSSKYTIGEFDYPFISLFGSEDIVVSQNDIHFKSDIIASIHFMLTRWEEQVITERDNHDRFPGYLSFAYKNNFLDRPIVNEYVEILWHALVQIGFEGSRKERTFTLVPTHDIDTPLMWMRRKDIFRSLMFSAIKAPNFNEFKEKLENWSKGKDPYDTYDMMMDVAETARVKSTFYFLTGGNTRYDSNYSIFDVKMQSIINRIQKRNHIVGLHPSYNTYLDVTLLGEEKDKFKDIEIEHSRQHYLRIEVPVTWANWQQVGVHVDRSMGYADLAGFRCGVCYPFPLFDFNNRQQLDVIEQPLIVMDVTLQQYENLSPKECIRRIDTLKSQTKRYQGDFVFLWHNSSFFTSEWRDYNEVFRSLYN